MAVGIRLRRADRQKSGLAAALPPAAGDSLPVEGVFTWHLTIVAYNISILLASLLPNPYLVDAHRVRPEAVRGRWVQVCHDGDVRGVEPTRPRGARPEQGEQGERRAREGRGHRSRPGLRLQGKGAALVELRSSTATSRSADRTAELSYDVLPSLPWSLLLLVLVSFFSLKFVAL